MSDVLLPGNATAQELAIEQTTSRVGEIAVPVRDVWNPDAAPSQTLPWLAWAFSVDEWQTSWTDQQKRDAIKASVAIHRQKGTIGALRKALAALDYSAQVQEWFAQIPSAPPYTFRLLLEADQTGWTLVELNNLIAVVESVKNLRSHLAEVAPSARSTSVLTAASVALTGNEITIAYSGPAVLNPIVIVAA